MSFDAKHLESFDLLRLGLFVCNKEGDILYANTAAQFLSGQSLKLLKERKLQYYLNSSDEWLANYRARPEPSFLVPNELDHFLRPPAEPIPVLVTVHPYPEDENVLLAEIVPADKTLQMTRERHMNELSEHTRRLLRNLAHEIKNPLSSISLHARDTSELLEEEPLDFSLMQENLRTIEQSVMRIDRIVLDLMDTVSIEQGRLALSLVPSDLGALLHSVEKDFNSHPSSGNNQLVLTIQPDLPEISADSERLIQVITNLISNAERHTQNGTITISLTGEPGWQTICVSDTGTGMSEEMRKNALKGYVSADKDYWRHGIGLYVCHQIITAHGGKIWLKSKEGEGTQVFFSLPEEVS